MFTVVVGCPSLMGLREELDAFSNSNAKRTIDVGHDVSWTDFPLICKYLLLAGWLASYNPTIDTQVSNRQRRRKTSKSEAARLEEEALMAPSNWKLDKLLSILDHLLTGNEEDEEANCEEETELSKAVPSNPASQLATGMEVEILETSVVGNGIRATASDGADNHQLSSSRSSHEPNDGFSESSDSDLSFDADEPGPFKPFQSSQLLTLLWEPNKGHVTQTEILVAIGVLEQVGLFTRVSSGITSKTSRSRAEYKCVYDARFINQIADSINFPLWGYM
jgi:hypothetical protein